MLGSVVLGLFAGTGSASAAGYNGVCGSGYSVIDHHDIAGGTVFLTYSSSTGNNCVVTVRNTPGTAIYMDAFIRLSGSLVWNDDPGYWTTYAGPRYVHAPGRCIDWGGSIGSVTWIEYNSHCRS
ncbi:spore-associated protein A [Amycolatopsis sp. NPDC049688]|uniref:spore-associated protein A n=1 Tax=Amycolatopsis sp. NPDC049688 TaxID=3154733 RepID=UPI00343DC1AA